MLLHARGSVLLQRAIHAISRIGQQVAGSTCPVLLQPLQPVLAARCAPMAAALRDLSSVSQPHDASIPGQPQHKRQKRPPVDGPRCPGCNNPCRDADRLVQHMRKCCCDLLPARLRVDRNPRTRPKGMLNGQHAALVAADPVLNDAELQQLLAAAKQKEDELRQQILHLLYISDDWAPSAGSVLDGAPSSTAKLSSHAHAGDVGDAASAGLVGDTDHAATSSQQEANNSISDGASDAAASIANGDGASTSAAPTAGRQGKQQLHHGKGKRRKTPEQLVTMLNLPLKRVEDLLMRAPKAIPLVIDNDPLDILYEDDALLAVAKPPGVCSAPAHRFAGGTMVNRIAGYLRIPQPHVLHRLDMNTSGVLLVAKGVDAARICHEQFEQKKVTKEYLALCIGGERTAGSTFSNDGAIGPHPNVKVARAVVEAGGQPALTHFEVLSSSCAATPVLEGRAGDVADASVLAASKGACLVRCQPVTGRTHQIRLHLAAAGHPLVGDEVYGIYEGPWIQRQALHAWRLTVQHPDGRGPITFSAPPPPDFVAAAQHLGLDLAPLAEGAGAAEVATPLAA